MKTIVIALGGNALQAEGQTPTYENQMNVIRSTARLIAPLARDHRLLVVHGNGPQVGRILIQNEYAASQTPSNPFDACGAMSQGLIGYPLQQALTAAMHEEGLDKMAATVLTQVVVSGDDPGFQHPTKPIGPFYTQEKADELSKEKGYVMKEDAGRGFRRVVASPDPIRIVEMPAIMALTHQGMVPICAGGGGIPVVEKEGALHGVPAVIDKDLAAERLAEDVDADVLLILTAVEQVSLHFKKPDQKDLSSVNPEELKRYMDEGHFAPGSMLPKMKAALRFAESRKGRTAIVTSLEKAVEALHNGAGTHIAG